MQPTEFKTLDEMSFSEALAIKANKDKATLVAATLKAFQDGEPSAIKLVTQAILEHQYQEEQLLPINDARIQEIICLVADHIKGPQD